MTAGNKSANLFQFIPMPIVGRFVSFSTVLAVLTIPLLGCFGGSQLETVKTEKDFVSPEAAVEFVNLHLPTELPSSAVVDELEFVSWLDWSLDARVKLSKEAGLGYVSEVASQMEAGEGEAGEGYDLEIESTPLDERPSSIDYVIEGELKMSGTISYDVETQMLLIHCRNVE